MSYQRKDALAVVTSSSESDANEHNLTDSDRMTSTEPDIHSEDTNI